MSRNVISCNVIFVLPVIQLINFTQQVLRVYYSSKPSEASSFQFTFCPEDRGLYLEFLHAAEDGGGMEVHNIFNCKFPTSSSKEWYTNALYHVILYRTTSKTELIRDSSWPGMACGSSGSPFLSHALPPVAFHRASGIF